MRQAKGSIFAGGVRLEKGTFEEASANVAVEVQNRPRCRSKMTIREIELDYAFAAVVARQASVRPVRCEC